MRVDIGGLRENTIIVMSLGEMPGFWLLFAIVRILQCL